MTQQMVSFTSQNQVNIPINMVRAWGKKPKKLMVTKVGEEIRLRPVKDFWSIVGSLKSDIVLSDAQLRKARGEFEKKWARKM
jgi:hypothetical protein